MKRSWAVAAAALLGLGFWLWPASATRHMRRRPVGSVSARVEAERALEAARVEQAEQAEQAHGDSEAAPAPTGSVHEGDMLRNRSVESLLARLDSSDQFLVIDAADGLRARKAVVAIPKLAAIDVIANPDSARTVIDALGHLAGNASGAERNTAVDRLLSLLAQEKKRETPDAPGNVLQIYEALGKTADPRAAQALERELADRSVPLAALTLVVDALVELGQSSSRAALSAARERIAALETAEGLEREIHRELLAKLEAAITAL